MSVVCLFLTSMYIMGVMPQNFFPSMDKPYFRADCFLPEGFSIRESEKMMADIESYLMKQEEVTNVSVTIGGSPLRYYLASTSFGPKANFGNLLIEVQKKEQSPVVEDRLNTYVRENYPDMLIRSSLFKLSPAVEAAIEIGFIGEDIDTLSALTERAMGVMRECDMVTDVREVGEIRYPCGNPATRRRGGNVWYYPAVCGLCFEDCHERFGNRGLPGEGFVYAYSVERGRVRCQESG